MHIGTLTNSKYLKHTDLQGTEPTVKIMDVRLEVVGKNKDGTDQEKGVLYFVGKEKGMVLNKTNIEMLALITGSEETEDWTGTAVTLFAVDTTDQQGRPTKGLRVRAAGKRKMKIETGIPPRQSENPAEDMNDEVPF